jgi:hypothetical protein
MKAAWRSLARLHLIGSKLAADSLEPAFESVIVPRRRRRQAVESTPNALDLRSLHDKVLVPVLTYCLMTLSRKEQLPVLLHFFVGPSLLADL